MITMFIPAIWRLIIPPSFFANIALVIWFQGCHLIINICLHLFTKINIRSRLYQIFRSRLFYFFWNFTPESFFICFRCLLLRFSFCSLCSLGLVLCFSFCSLCSLCLVLCFSFCSLCSLCLLLRVFLFAFCFLFIFFLFAFWFLVIFF